MKSRLDRAMEGLERAIQRTGIETQPLQVDPQAIRRSGIETASPTIPMQPWSNLDAQLLRNSTTNAAAGANETFAIYTTGQDCLVNTGGVCTFSACHKERGPTSCQDGTCICKGGCTGADGICRKQKNKVVLADFTMQNFRWQTYLYADDSNLRVTRDAASLSNHFTLMQTPDDEFIIYAKAAPDYALTASLNYRKLSPTQVNMKGSDGVFSSYPAPPAGRLALIFTAPPGGYNDKKRKEPYRFNQTRPVMLQSFAYPRHYIHSPAASIGDAPAMSYDDPGDGALWIFEPPLPAEFFAGSMKGVQSFRGKRCHWDCHGDSKNANIWFWVVIILISVLLCCCCCSMCLKGGDTVQKQSAKASNRPNAGGFMRT